MSEDRIHPAKRWWEIEDSGGWPGYWTPPPLYLSGPGPRGARRNLIRTDPRTSGWSLRPHP